MRSKKRNVKKNILRITRGSDASCSTAEKLTAVALCRYGGNNLTIIFGFWTVLLKIYYNVQYIYIYI